MGQEGQFKPESYPPQSGKRMGKIQIKRIYEPAETSDRFRVLVDRLWPRGISKERAALDLWMKDIAPSAELRLWFGHDPKRWTEFQKRYRAEPKEHQSDLAELRAQARKGTVTLLFGARDVEHNEAVVLEKILER